MHRTALGLLIDFLCFRKNKCQISVGDYYSHLYVPGHFLMFSNQYFFLNISLSVCNPGWPRTFHEDQTGLNSHRSTSLSLGVGIKGVSPYPTYYLLLLLLLSKPIIIFCLFFSSLSFLPRQPGRLSPLPRLSVLIDTTNRVFPLPFQSPRRCLSLSLY